MIGRFLRRILKGTPNGPTKRAKVKRVQADPAHKKAWQDKFDFPSSSRVQHEPRLKPNCHLSIGEDSIVEGMLTFEKEGASISIGDRCFVNGHVISSERVTIGDDVLISWNVTVTDHNSHSLRFSERSRDVQEWAAGRKDWSHVEQRPVQIRSKAWIGFNASILKGVTIGEGAVVGAGSVVTKDVPDWTVVAGNPARVIRELDLDER